MGTVTATPILAILLLAVRFLGPAVAVPVAASDLKVLLHLAAIWPTRWLPIVDCEYLYANVGCNSRGYVTRLEFYGHAGTKFPEEITKLQYLEFLDLTGSAIYGPLPESIGNLKLLKYLFSSNNGLSGPLPKSFVNLTKLELLSLASNRLSGPLTAAIGNLKHMQSLSLGRNQFTGPIPASLGIMTGLTFLDLSTNQLAGIVPRSIVQLKNLMYLHLDNNQLTGTLPTSFPKKLVKYTASDNYITGVAAFSKNVVASCPNYDRNCITRASVCRRVSVQKTKLQCASFCHVASGLPPPCSEHGYCFLAARKTQGSCICDAKYKSGPKFTCIKSVI